MSEGLAANLLHIGGQESLDTMEAKSVEGTMARTAAETTASYAESKLVLSPLSQLGWCTVASTTRFLISPRTDAQAAVRRTLEALEVDPIQTAYCVQRHTSKVALLEGIRRGWHNGFLVIPECDGLVACHAGQAVAVFTADCVPVVMVDPLKRIIAAVHAGWRGTFHEIAKNAVRQIIEAGGRPSDMRVWIGPAIGGCCYEVSPELAAAFREKFGYLNGVQAFVRGRFLDLIRLNVLQLASCGILIDHIEWCGFCTKCRNGMFYSYRVEGDRAGRIVTLVVRTK